MENMCSLIEDFCNQQDGCTFYPSYSGRWMYGRTCVGIVIDDRVYENIVSLCDFLHDAGILCVSDALGSIQSDNMGLSWIIYMPKLTGKQ